MAYKPKIVLQAPLRPGAPLETFVEACLADGVELIAVVGDGCAEVHDLIDDIIVGDGADDTRCIATSWHTGESLAEVVEFASIYGSGDASGVEVVSL